MDKLWRIEMLGWLRATQADRVIAHFRSRKTAALLAYLAYHPQLSHPREVLIELLWPETPAKAGRLRLRSELCWLRQRLEPPGVPAGTILLTDGDTLRLNPATCVTDVAAFETAMRSAAGARTRADRIRWLTEAVNLHRGELLPGHFEAWVLPERLRLEEALLGAMHELVAEREQADDLPGALQLAWRAAAVDPLREETHADLVRLLATTGQWEAALRQCRDWQRLLGVEAEGWDPAPRSLAAARERALFQELCVWRAEAEELRRQLAVHTAEAEALRERLLAEMAEMWKLLA
jgi:DNA-binding SARP family transcriptional activator